MTRQGWLGFIAAAVHSRCPHRSSPRPPLAAGFSLVEVLVTIVITAVGVLGAAALQLNAVKFNQVADMRSQATFFAYGMADRMRANREAARAGRYDLDLDDDAPAGTAVHEVDLRDWLNALAARLPGGDGAIERDGGSVTVTVRWKESRVAGSREGNGPHLQDFVFVTEL